jgi:hypothetical protein
MFEKHKMKKEAKRKFRDLQSTQMANQMQQQNEEEGEVRSTNYARLASIMNVKADIMENLGWIIVGCIILLVEYFIIGILYTLPTFIFMALIIRGYTRRFYRVPLQYVLLTKIEENKQTFVGFFGFPYKIFNYVDTEGVENMIRTPNYGPVYLASDIVFEGDIPVKIKFSYIHFSQYDFITKKQTYPLMVEYLNRLIIMDTKLREMMDLNTAAMAADITSQRLKRISQGKTEDVLKLHTEREKLMKEIAEIMNRNEETENNLNKENGAIEEEEEDVNA